jgi:quercetin dioxygenase-like cupin family protein
MQEVQSLARATKGNSMSDSSRSRIDVHAAQLQPYDRYGEPAPGVTWRPLNYDPERGAGSFLLALEPGARTPAHEHTEIEEILVLAGDFIDSDGSIFGPGDFLTYPPGTRHYSTSRSGCRLLVEVRAYGRRLSDADALD